MVWKESQRHHGRGKGCQLFCKVSNTVEDGDREDWGPLLEWVVMDDLSMLRVSSWWRWVDECMRDEATRQGSCRPGEFLVRGLFRHLV